MARRNHRRSKVTRVINLIKRIIAFFFSHVGLCALVIGYALLGAVVFRAVEGPHETFIQGQVTTARQKAVNIAWNATFRYRCSGLIKGMSLMISSKAAINRLLWIFQNHCTKY
uniref:BMA-TWK-48, isoform a n=1 Tax=Brugia malayi TaxID=6279 RepID=A0A0J9Y164_BRUMA|nr:BMA-TWK-48, isoform a [Brugia malayi]